MRRAGHIPLTLPEWLWDDRIPRGAITLIVGKGGIGKSTLAVELAARLSQRDLTGQAEDSLLVLQEDHEESVTVPRLTVANANLNRVYLDGDPGYRFPRDLDRLDSRIARHGIKLAVIDPLDASVPSLASQPARAVLDALAAIARRRNAALVALHHLTKTGRGPEQRIDGGRAVQAVARSILLLHGLDRIARLMLEVPDEMNVVGLHHHKSSYATRADELFLERVLEDHPVQGGKPIPRLVVTDEFDDVALPDEDLVLPERPRGWRRDVARDLIQRFLLHGPMTAEDLQADVMVAEIRQETFERARAELAAEGVIEQFQKDGRHWWRLVVPNSLPNLP